MNSSAAKVPSFVDAMALLVNSDILNFAAAPSNEFIKVPTEAVPVETPGAATDVPERARAAPLT